MYLQRILCAYGNDVVLVVAQLTAPAAPFADPLDEARLMGTLDRTVTAARAQQLPLQGERHRVVRPRVWLMGSGAGRLQAWVGQSTPLKPGYRLCWKVPDPTEETPASPPWKPGNFRELN